MSERPPARTADKWRDTEPPAERTERLQRWQNYQSCADCTFWGDQDEDKTHGACVLVSVGSFITPEDYTCKDFTPKDTP